MNKRRLKVEPMEERFGAPAPKAMLRLKGRWLKAAGFDPGEQVEVILESPGLLTIRRCTAAPPNGDEHWHLNEQAELNLDALPAQETFEQTAPHHGPTL